MIDTEFARLASQHISSLCFLSLLNIIFSYINTVLHKRAFNSRMP